MKYYKRPMRIATKKQFKRWYWWYWVIGLILLTVFWVKSLIADSSGTLQWTTHLILSFVGPLALYITPAFFVLGTALTLARNLRAKRRVLNKAMIGWFIGTMLSVSFSAWVITSIVSSGF